jgi:predicted transposase YbfD/YdcC
MPDTRSNSGKRHSLSFVLFGLTLGLLNGHSRLSALSRYLKNKHEYLCTLVGHSSIHAISDCQLRRVLSGVDWQKYDALSSRFFEIAPSQILDTEWIALDGKELCGSISIGDKRGETLVYAITHDSKMVVGQTFHDSTKISERTSVDILLTEQNLWSGCLTLDSLHNSSAFLSKISEHGGKYLVRIKKNQKELLEELEDIGKKRKSMFDHTFNDKGHGRVEERKVAYFDLSDDYFEERWVKTNLQTLLKIDKKTYHCKTKKETVETGYYISNQIVKTDELKATELSNAQRQHWNIEVNNYIRDMLLNEDDCKTPKGNTAKIMACLRTTALHCIKKAAIKNLKSLMQLWKDVPEQLEKHLKVNNFLPNFT